MSREEFKKFAMTLRTFYPKENLFPNEQSMELWFKMVAEVPYEHAITYLQKWVSLEKWSPSVSDILKGCAEMVQGQTKDWGEAWAEVKRAISKYGYMNEELALKSMSEEARAVVMRMGWKDICFTPEEDIATLRAQFRQMFEITTKRTEQNRQIPGRIQQQIEAIHLDWDSKKELESGVKQIVA